MFVMDLNRNLFYILQSISAVVEIKSRGVNCKCRIYLRLVVIDLHIGTKF